jgi:hypothetical protein
VPRLVYHLFTKLKNDVIHNCLGQIEEVKLIRFLTRYGYATRLNIYCKIHGAYGKYTNMQNVTYINNCDNWNRIILLTQADRAYGTEISPRSFVASFVILLYAISYNICI